MRPLILETASWLTIFVEIVACTVAMSLEPETVVYDLCVPFPAEKATPGIPLSIAA
jgi:ABC-type Co2+ transport system permease subunit